MYDLIVAGGGPAGSTAARAAALQGLDILILEKETFPRYKPCGGALSSKAASLLDFPLPSDICERTITGARVHFRDRVLEKHKGYNLTTLIDRSRFDYHGMYELLGFKEIYRAHRKIDRICGIG